MLSIQCECGRTTEIRLAQAGSVIACRCGRRLAVPRLSVLQRCLKRNVPVPAEVVTAVSSDAARVEDNAIQAGGMECFCGQIVDRVGPEKSISSTAFENYTSLILRRLVQWLETQPRGPDWQLLVSCALIPDHPPFIHVQSVGFEQSVGLEAAVESTVLSVLTPPVFDGPVGFAVNCRAHAGLPMLMPFGRIGGRMESEEFDRLICDVTGYQAPAPPKVPLWQRMLRTLGMTKVKESTPREEYRRQRDWFWQQCQRIAEGDPDAVDPLHDTPRYLPVILTINAQHCAAQEKWQEARDYFRRAIACMPDFGMLYALRGKVYLAEDDSQHALADFSRAIDRNPFDSWVFEDRGRIYGQLEAWDQAIADFSTAIELDPRDPDPLYCRAMASANQGLMSGASDDIETALKLDPNSIAVNLLRGDILAATAPPQWEAATAAFDRVLEIAPEFHAVRLRRAWCSQQLNKFVMAIEDCDRVLLEEPDNAEAHGMRGHLLQLDEQYDESIEACSRAIELGLQAPYVFVARGRCYVSNDQLEPAWADCHSALEIAPHDPQVLNFQGFLALHDGDVDTAIEAFGQASKHAPDWVEPRMLEALAHRIGDNPETAIEKQTDLILQEPEVPVHYMNRALAYNESKDYAAAQADYTHAIQMQPEFAAAWYARGLFFDARQEHDRALHDFNRCLECDPNNDQALYMRAKTRMHLKHYDDAMEDFSKLIDRHPSNPTAHLERAHLQQLMGRGKHAREDYQRLAELAPEHNDLWAQQALISEAVRHLENHEYALAIKIAEQCLEQDHELASAQRIRGAAFWYDEDVVTAEEIFSELLGAQTGEESAELLSVRGQIRAEMGEYESALEDLDQAVAISRDAGETKVLATALNGRALALAGLDRHEESERDYEHAVRLSPGNCWTYYNRGLVLFKQNRFRDAEHLLELALSSEDHPLPPKKMRRTKVMLQQIAAETGNDFDVEGNEDT